MNKADTCRRFVVPKLRVGRLAKSLEDKNYLVREVRQANTNLLHLTTLMTALVDLKKGTKPKKVTA